VRDGREVGDVGGRVTVDQEQVGSQAGGDAAPVGETEVVRRCGAQPRVDALVAEEILRPDAPVDDGQRRDDEDAAAAQGPGLSLRYPLPRPKSLRRSQNLRIGGHPLDASLSRLHGGLR
jgi:hypothetical protein